jgi:bile acid:Na+ symporter, BASS family
MNLAALIRAAFPVSIGLIVFALGLRCMPEDATSLLRDRRLLFRSLLAMNLVQPLVALLLVVTTQVHAAVKIALFALAVSPVPPILPDKQLKAGGRQSYVYGELVASSVLAIVLVPLTLLLLEVVSGRDVPPAPATVARIVSVSVLVPLVLGMLGRRWWPAFAARASHLTSVTGNVVLVAAALVASMALWPSVSSLIGNGTLLVCLAFALIGLAAGHLLGGPDPDDQTVLALSTAARHPGVAIAIGSAAFPDQKAVTAAVVLYLFASAVVSAPYIAWRKRLRASTVPRASF